MSAFTPWLLLLSLPVLLPGPTQTNSAKHYAGDWVRSTQAQNFIVYLSITTGADQQILVHAWGPCKRTPEDGGTRADCEDWGTASATVGEANTASLFQPFRREMWDLHLSEGGGSLLVRVRDSDIVWARDPGVGLVRDSRPQAEPPAQPPVPPASPPAQTCSITGTLSGPLEGVSHPDSRRASDEGSTPAHGADDT